MSNYLAIATVTATLYNILDERKEDAGVTVSTKPPDKARAGNASGKQVNIFLYHTELSEAWRNRDMPRKVRPGELGHPPLPLRLYYLITAYGADDDEVGAHRVLGRAMSNLHDHPILGPEELRDANDTLAGSDLHEQIERVRITPQPLSLDDMYKLWSSFQTQYRPSTAYQASVVLIESARPARAPLPVLTRSEGDSGVGVQPDLIPPFPTLTAILPPGRQPAARLGERVILQGHHLGGDKVQVLLRHARAADPVVLAPERGGTDRELRVILPADSQALRAGIHSVSAIVQRRGEPERPTNELPLAVAPRITSIEPNPADLSAVDALTVTCEPEVLPEQKPVLLLGDRKLSPVGHTGPASSLEFPLAGVPAGEYIARLRVDGVDSLIIDYSQTPPKFDPEQKVRLT